MICNNDNCERQARCRGMCGYHYQRWRRAPDNLVPSCPGCNTRRGSIAKSQPRLANGHFTADVSHGAA